MTLPIQRLSVEKWWTRNVEFHVLTFAELGASPLGVHGDAAGIQRDRLLTFTMDTNAQGVVRTLFPWAEISAVPRSALRGMPTADRLARHLVEFFVMNRANIGARRLAIDFRTPVVPNVVGGALEIALAKVEPGPVDHIVVIDHES